VLNLMVFENSGRPTSWISKKIEYLNRHYVKIGQAVLMISRFFDFQDGGRPPCWICKLQLLLRIGDPMCVTVQNFVKIDDNVADILQFITFQDGAVRHLGFMGIHLGSSTNSNWRTLSLCKIWLESLQ